jgi:hypothetical protein
VQALSQVCRRDADARRGVLTRRRNSISPHRCSNTTASGRLTSRASSSSPPLARSDTLPWEVDQRMGQVNHSMSATRELM